MIHVFALEEKQAEAFRQRAARWRRGMPTIPISLAAVSWSMILSENRYPPIGSWPEGKLFRIML